MNPVNGKKRPSVIFFGGPDGCGKTEVSTALSRELCVPRFKAPTEVKNWKDGTFKQSLKFDYLLPSFVAQTGTSFVSDRSYACEWVYAQTFRPETFDEKLLREVDNGWLHADAMHVILTMNDFKLVRPDELVDRSRLKEISDRYIEFCQWTCLPAVVLEVDSYITDFQDSPVEHASGGNVQLPVYDLKRQIGDIMSAMDEFYGPDSKSLYYEPSV